MMGSNNLENNKLKIEKGKSKKLIGRDKLLDSLLGKGKDFSSFFKFFLIEFIK